MGRPWKQGLTRLYGEPATTPSDNKMGFLSRAILEWLTAISVDRHLTAPTKVIQNALFEAINARLRVELLGEFVFSILVGASKNLAL